jgi:hypothetical protein
LQTNRIYLPSIASSYLDPVASPLSLINFQDPFQRIRIRITPPDRRVNRGKPILISFYPAQTCLFGDQRGCVTEYQNSSGIQNVLVSVHSGVGGEGQAFRHALEGTTYTGAKLSLKQIRANLAHLAGAAVTIEQGDRLVSGLTLLVVQRIPPAGAGAYFDAPIQSALAQGAGFNPALNNYLDTGRPLLIFETCGWQVPGEALKKGANSTSASVYFGVIR